MYAMTTEQEPWYGDIHSSDIHLSEKAEQVKIWFLSGPVWWNEKYSLQPDKYNDTEKHLSGP